MKEKCPSTCGKCDIKNANLCKDASDSVMCSTMVQFCNSLDFYDQMSEQCASTCNRCPNPGDSGPPCLNISIFQIPGLEGNKLGRVFGLTRSVSGYLLIGITDIQM
ncbi:shTK domain protein [Necator americanus]|uniref:ShTK domain protein n=1 Tax=Necator americanus TaxID=51031 RepID=W2T6T8_NECAM|nr:shTK domain protein [Necator americanus]ETN77720.1 shTK domain protein [Necator americanus]